MYESHGCQEIQEVIDGQLRTFSVSGLLDGVDLPDKRERKSSKSSRRVKLFYSYSHKDEALRDELEAHLKILERQKLIAPWHDRRILPSEDWDDEIDDNLEAADLILLLVSANFMNSDYIDKVELKRALEKEREGSAKVVPVILSSVDWDLAEFSYLQALPKDADAVTSWKNRDEAWTDVAKGIRKVVEEILSKK